VITQQKLKELFYYKDGHLYNIKNRSSNSFKDERIGHTNLLGYISTAIDTIHYYEHRLIWMFHYGYMPKYIDHIDRNPSNNNLGNLREVSQRMNTWNRTKGKNTSSQYKGVFYDKRCTYRPWRARIKNKTIGHYKTELEAAHAFDEKSLEVYGEYGNLNFPLTGES